MARILWLRLEKTPRQVFEKAGNPPAHASGGGKKGMKLLRLCAIAIAAARFSDCHLRAAELDGPLSPQQSLQSFRTRAGTQGRFSGRRAVGRDPVAMAFDEAGRLFVVESRGYPTGPGPGQPPAGVIALLEDTDGDGRYDKRTVFADGLTFPNGLMPWKGGLIVTCAPDILYLKDTNGDGRADLKKVLFTGFSTSGSTQLRVSHPTLGIDGWIYLTSGLTGGKVTSPEYPNHPAVESKTDFRFRPDTDQFEAAEGRARYGMSFDDFGHRFICMNRMHVQHVVMPARYVPSALSIGEPVQNVPESLEPEPVRGHGQAAKVYPISKNVTTADSHAGTFTSACAVMVYRGTGLPQGYYGNVFACEPAGNLVHRDALIAKGSTFAARRVYQGIEFLASTDNWFRPVYLTQGPDGAVYVCAMYRKVIDHPDYLPGDLRKHLDFDAGKGMGRIYRVAAADKSRESLKAMLLKTNSAALCKGLEHANGWQRDTAFRLLLEAKPASVVGQLEDIVRKSDMSVARVLALRLLDAFKALPAKALQMSFTDLSAGVRENALQIAEQSQRTESLSPFEVLADDPSARVRFQCALALAGYHNAGIVNPLARIALRDANDRWSRAAVLSSAAPYEESFLKRVLENPKHSEGFVQLLSEAGRQLAVDRPPEKLKAILELVLTKQTVDESDWQIAAINGLFDGARTRGAAATKELREQILNLQSPKDAAEHMLTRAASFLEKNATYVSTRVSAATLLGNLSGAGSIETLAKILDPKEPQEIQLAAIRALGRISERKAAEVLLSKNHWPGYSPVLRDACLAAVLGQPSMHPVLLDRVEKSEIPASALTTAQRKQLVQAKDPSTRDRAEALFKNLQGGNRMKVYEEWKSALQLRSDAAHGRAVFKQYCSACHRLDQEGTPVGPDLFGMRNQSKEVILLHIIVPEYEIVPGYVSYTVALKDGNVEQGMIAAENPTSITLRRALGEELTISRANIAALASSGLSLMPQGLEANMSRQDMADLLAYLKGE